MLTRIIEVQRKWTADFMEFEEISNQFLHVQHSLVKSVTCTCVTSLKLPCPKQPLLPLPNVIMMPLSEKKKDGVKDIGNTHPLIKKNPKTNALFCLADLLTWLKQRRAADQPVMQVVNRSPQDTDLMVTPDWPSRKREINWGCICSTAPGRLTSPDPTEGACKVKVLKKKTHTIFTHVGGWTQSSRRIHIVFTTDFPRSWFNVYKRVLDTDLPCDQTSWLGYSHLLSASQGHLQHLGVEHWQAERRWDSISPRIHWRQRDGMHLPWT